MYLHRVLRSNTSSRIRISLQKEFLSSLIVVLIPFTRTFSISEYFRFGKIHVSNVWLGKVALVRLFCGALYRELSRDAYTVRSCRTRYRCNNNQNKQISRFLYEAKDFPGRGQIVAAYMHEIVEAEIVQRPLGGTRQPGNSRFSRIKSRGKHRNTLPPDGHRLPIEHRQPNCSSKCITRDDSFRCIPNYRLKQSHLSTMLRVRGPFAPGSGEISQIKNANRRRWKLVSVRTYLPMFTENLRI